MHQTHQTQLAGKMPTNNTLKVLRRKLLWAEKKALKTGHYKSRVKVDILKRKIMEEEMLEILLI
jgi:hypothetical protein